MSAKTWLITVSVSALLSFGVLLNAEPAHAQVYNDYYACSNYDPYYGNVPCYNYDYGYYPYWWGFSPFFAFDFRFHNHHRHFNRFAHRDFDRFGNRGFARGGSGFATTNRARFNGGFGSGAHTTFARSGGGGFRGGSSFGGGGMHGGGGFHGGGGGHGGRR